MWSDWLPCSTRTRMQVSSPGAASALVVKSCLLMMGTAPPFMSCPRAMLSRAMPAGELHDRTIRSLRPCPATMRAPPLGAATDRFRVVSGCGIRTGTLFERDHPIDDGIPYAFGLLDEATLLAWEVRGIHRAVIQEAQLLLLVDDEVGSEPFSQDTPVRESSDPGGQPADLVVGFFQAHDLAISGPHR